MHITSISKNVYIEKLNDMVYEQNNKYHSQIKMKPANVNSSKYADIENNLKDAKFEAGNHVTIFKYKTIFAKSYSLNWSEDVLVIEKVKNTVP